MKKKNASILALILAVSAIGGTLSACGDVENSSVASVETTVATTEVTTTQPPVTTVEETTTVTTTQPPVTTQATTTKTPVTTKATTTKAPVTTTVKATTTEAPVTTISPVTVTGTEIELGTTQALEDTGIIETTVFQTAAPAATTKAVAATTKAPAATTKAPTATVATVGSPYNKYVYNSLNAEEKKMYADIYNAVKNFQPSVKFAKSYPAATINKIYEHVFFQEPDIFWFSGVQNVASTTTNTIPLQYKWSKSEVATMQKKIDATVAAIKASIPKGAPVTQQIKIMHDYILQRTIFSKQNQYATSAYGPLAGSYGQCEGYAKAATYMCNQLGIQNVRITGFNDKKATHAWNKVLIDGKWYNLDLTWDDPENHTRSTYFKNNYLLVPDAEVNNISHFPKTTFTPPVANSLNENYFVKYGYYVNDYNSALAALKKQMAAAVPSKLEVIQVKCTTKEVYDALTKQLNGAMVSYQSELNKTNTNKIAKLQVGHDPNTRIIQYNLVY